MLFKYKSVDNKGIQKEGQIDAPNQDMAISALQRRGFVILAVEEVKESKSIFKMSFFQKVSNKDVVILSRQIATLFDAQVSALKAFNMLASNVENPLLSQKLTQVVDDLQSGVSISGSLAKHPDVFSDFYVNMVRAGEETGKLNQTFLYLAEYLDRQYAITNKTRNALIYPFFVVVTFFVVLGVMLVVVIPKLSAILTDTGQELPIYTKVVIAMSDFFVRYGFIVIILLFALGAWVYSLSRSKNGQEYLDRIKLDVPVVGNLYKKLFLSRISDNLNTMLTSGIPIVRSIDITSEVVSNRVYESILKKVAEEVKSGLSISNALDKYPDQIPGILVQMVKVGEETGSLGQILKTLSDFYKREVDDAVDTLVGLIEPFMIVFLGLAVGLLLVSVLMPIYNLAGGIV